MYSGNIKTANSNSDIHPFVSFLKRRIRAITLTCAIQDRQTPLVRDSLSTTSPYSAGQPAHLVTTGGSAPAFGTSKVKFGACLASFYSVLLYLAWVLDSAYLPHSLSIYD
ncbi:hypothetical protein LZ31DRAFT_230611 [Colletotrichum somersetense]|nr:hypothetical protein LZ31DRAFT_230611 [Colletotrichum somersetense]